MKEWRVNINDGEDPEAIFSELGAKLHRRARRTLISPTKDSAMQGDVAIVIRAEDRVADVEKVIEDVIQGRGSIER